MIIPGFVIAWLTFPGVIVHEAAHVLFCKLRGVVILEACFFQFANPPGYVIHEKVESFNTAFLICVGPFLLNSLLCVLICFPTYLPMQVFNVSDPLSYVLLWLGISIGMHAFPSMQDAGVLYEEAKRAARSLHPLAILSFPLVLMIYVANVASIVWADLIYGVAIGIGLPALVLRL
jgi:hypothetical protein